MPSRSYFHVKFAGLRRPLRGASTGEYLRTPDIELSREESDQLRQMACDRARDGRVAVRAAIILACAKPGATNSAVARILGVSRSSVILWRQRFACKRMAAIAGDR